MSEQSFYTEEQVRNLECTIAFLSDQLKEARAENAYLKTKVDHQRIQLHNVNDRVRSAVSDYMATGKTINDMIEALR